MAGGLQSVDDRCRRLRGHSELLGEPAGRRLHPGPFGVQEADQRPYVGRRAGRYSVRTPPRPTPAVLRPPAAGGPAPAPPPAQDPPG